MIREFSTEEYQLYAGAVRWDCGSGWGNFGGSAPLICEVGDWTLVLSAVGTEAHRVEEKPGSTITVYGALNGPISKQPGRDFCMPLSFPTQRFAYSWLLAVEWLFSMTGMFNPADYGMIELATI